MSFYLGTYSSCLVQCRQVQPHRLHSFAARPLPLEVLDYMSVCLGIFTTVLVLVKWPGVLGECEQYWRYQCPGAQLLQFSVFPLTIQKPYDDLVGTRNLFEDPVRVKLA